MIFRLYQKLKNNKKESKLCFTYNSQSTIPTKPWQGHVTFTVKPKLSFRSRSSYEWHYSYRSVFTGFLLAAFNDLKPTAIRATTSDMIPAVKKTAGPICTW